MSYKIADSAVDDRKKYLIVCPADSAFKALGEAATDANSIKATDNYVETDQFKVPFYFGKDQALTSVLSYIWTANTGLPLFIKSEELKTKAVG